MFTMCASDEPIISSQHDAKEGVSGICFLFAFQAEDAATWRFDSDLALSAGLYSYA